MWTLLISLGVAIGVVVLGIVVVGGWFVLKELLPDIGERLGVLAMGLGAGFYGYVSWLSPGLTEGSIFATTIGILLLGFAALVVAVVFLKDVDWH